MPLITLPNRREFFRAAGGAVLAARHMAAQGTPKSIHWALLSDTHLSVDQKTENRGFKPYENLKRTIPEVKRANPQAIIINGDLAKLEGLPTTIGFSRQCWSL